MMGLLLALILGSTSGTARAQTIWELTPYNVRVLVALAPVPELAEPFQRQLQRELAETAELPVRTVRRIELGEVDVRVSTLEKIARALGCELKDLT